MRKYLMIKNVVLAGLVGFIYYKYIVPSTPVMNKVFAVAFVCAMVLSVAENLDEKKITKIRAKRKAHENKNERTGRQTKCAQEINQLKCNRK